MTAQPLHSPAQPAFNWQIIAIVMAVLINFAGAVAFGVRVEAQVAALQQTTEPLRRGDLVAIQTDVAWMRSRMEREERRETH